MPPWNGVESVLKESNKINTRADEATAAKKTKTFVKEKIFNEQQLRSWETLFFAIYIIDAKNKFSTWKRSFVIILTYNRASQRAGLYAFPIFHSSRCFFSLFFLFYDKTRRKNVLKFNLLLTGKPDVDNVKLCLVSQFYVLRSVLASTEWFKIIECSWESLLLLAT